MKTCLTFSAVVLAVALGLPIHAASGGKTASSRLNSGDPSYWSARSLVSETAPKGKVLFDRYCAACHGAGLGKPGTAELQIKYGGTVPALLEDRKDLDFAMVRRIIRHGYEIMAPMRKTEITDADVDVIAAYLAADNSTVGNDATIPGWRGRHRG